MGAGRVLGATLTPCGQGLSASGVLLLTAQLPMQPLPVPEAAQ